MTTTGAVESIDVVADRRNRGRPRAVVLVVDHLALDRRESGGYAQRRRQKGRLDTCRYLYLPRLASDAVFVDTVRDGAAHRDCFGYAAGTKDGAYQGVLFGNLGAFYLDDGAVLIRPDAVPDTSPGTLSERLRARAAAARVRLSRASTVSRGAAHSAARETCVR